jgi:NDP-sugar pyrophosphorylase family protein
MTAPADFCALILAAGEGRRLRPITATLPKALCPVGNVALLDRALDRLARHGLTGPGRVAVNVSHLAEQVTAHVAGRTHISVEPRRLGTAGAVANLRDWTAGRPLLVGNADAYLVPRSPWPDLAPLWEGWDGTTVRVLVVPEPRTDLAEFGAARFAGFSLLPAGVIADLPAGPSELVLEVWRPAERAGRLEVVDYDGFYLDTGTPPDFLRANLHAAAGGSLVADGATVSGTVEQSVVGRGAVVRGSVLRSVVFPDGSVGPGESLVDAIRVGSSTTLSVDHEPQVMIDANSRRSHHDHGDLGGPVAADRDMVGRDVPGSTVPPRGET